MKGLCLMLGSMGMKVAILLLGAVFALVGCEDAQTQARPLSSPSPTTVTVVASDRGAPLTSSKYLRDVRFDCASNDAAAVTGRWEGPDDPVTLTVVDTQGRDHDTEEASPGPFVLLLRSKTLPHAATVDVQARNEQDAVVDSVRIVLRYGPRGPC